MSHSNYSRRNDTTSKSKPKMGFGRAIARVSTWSSQSGSVDDVVLPDVLDSGTTGYCHHHQNLSCVEEAMANHKSALPGSASVGLHETAAVGGTQRGPFGRAEWVLFASAAIIWGASFMFIDLSLRTVTPAVVALARITLGAVTLSMFPRARSSIAWADLPRVAVLGTVWMGLPFLLVPLAQQHVDSSVAGMINGAAPVFTTVIAALLLRRFPRRLQLSGLTIGFFGVLLISLPNLFATPSSAYGVGLLLVTMALYGVAFNVAVPLQQRYGSLPVVLHAQLLALPIVIPFGLGGISGATWSVASALAMLALGVLSSGVAFVAMTTLVGRVGAARGSASVYAIPVVAVILGVIILNEPVYPLAIVGSLLVLLGAWLMSRSDGAVKSVEIRRTP